MELEKHQRACGYLAVGAGDEKGYCPAAHKVRHDLDTDESVKKMMDICGPPGTAEWAIDIAPTADPSYPMVVQWISSSAPFTCI